MEKGGTRASNLNGASKELNLHSRALLKLNKKMQT